MPAKGEGAPPARAEEALEAEAEAEADERGEFRGFARALRSVRMLSQFSFWGSLFPLS